MRRRELLQRAAWASGVLAAITGRAETAWGLGGILPELHQPAPPFSLRGVAPDATGGVIETQLALEDCKGRWVVLYFYPKDFTSGCTLEARGFQRDLQRFTAAGSAVIGISADDPEQHADFCGSEGLRYPLLSDPGGLVSQRYGSWIAPFSQRHTFLIDPTGTLQARWTAVRPAAHSQEVLAELLALQGQSA